MNRVTKNEREELVHQAAKRLQYLDPLRPWYPTNRAHTIGVLMLKFNVSRDRATRAIFKADVRRNNHFNKTGVWK